MKNGHMFCFSVFVPLGIFKIEYFTKYWLEPPNVINLFSLKLTYQVACSCVVTEKYRSGRFSSLSWPNIIRPLNGGIKMHRLSVKSFFWFSCYLRLKLVTKKAKHEEK